MSRLAAPALVLALLQPLEASAECPPDCSLGDLRRLALENSPDIEQLEALVDEARGQLDEARYAGLDLGRASLAAAPTALRRGDLVQSEQGDVSFSDEMGLWASIEVELALAVTPWWTIVEYWRAAQGGLELSRHDLEREQADVALGLERVYREAQLARAVVAALRRGRRAVGQALARIEGLLEEDLPGATEADRLRLVVVDSEFEARALQFRQRERRALARLRSLTGLPRNAPLRLERLVAGEPSETPLDWYLEAARRRRPEVRMSLAAIGAAEHLVRARQSELVPELAIGAFYSFHGAPEVDDQHSPFVSDPWNGYGFGYGLVYRWLPSLGERLARVREARADLDQARAMRRFALGGVAFEVEQAFLDVREDEAALRARGRSRDVAARRFDALLEDHHRGRAEASELSGAATDWLGQELEVLQATSRLLLSRTRLERATGGLLPAVGQAPSD